MKGLIVSSDYRRSFYPGSLISFLSILYCFLLDHIYVQGERERGSLLDWITNHIYIYRSVYIRGREFVIQEKKLFTKWGRKNFTKGTWDKLPRYFFCHSLRLYRLCLFIMNKHYYVPQRTKTSEHIIPLVQNMLPSASLQTIFFVDLKMVTNHPYRDVMWILIYPSL